MFLFYFNVSSHGHKYFLLFLLVLNKFGFPNVAQFKEIYLKVFRKRGVNRYVPVLALKKSLGGCLYFLNQHYSS